MGLRFGDEVGYKISRSKRQVESDYTNISREQLKEEFGACIDNLVGEEGLDLRHAPDG